MKPNLGAALCGLALLAAATLGYAAGARGWLASEPSHVGLPSPMGPGERERKVLYYRHPMGLPDTSPLPKKDSMGMDYIAVYEGDEEDGPGVKVSVGKVQRAGVRTAPAELRKITRPVRAPGVAKPDERTLRTVTLRADAFLEKLFVNETGQHVSAGDPLFRVYSQAMVAAQVDYRTAVTTPGRGEREEEGARQRLVNLDLPQHVLDALRASPTPAMTIDWPAPVSGVVLEKKAVEGQMVRMGDELYRIADLGSIWVIADVPEQDLGLISVGASAKVRFRAIPDRSYEGRITFILHELDKETRTAKVRIEVANPEHRIKHEMYGEVEIDAGADDGERLAVPRSSVIDSGSRQIVIVDLGDGRFEPRPVMLGVTGEDFVEVRTGLAPGDKVVVAANFLIDAESNLKAALQGLTAGEAPATPDTPREDKR